MKTTFCYGSDSVSVDCQNGNPALCLYAPEFDGISDLTISQLVEIRNELTPDSPLKHFGTKKYGIKNISALLVKLLAAKPKTTPTHRTNTRLAVTNVITLNVTENPKRKNTRAFDKFQVLMGFNGRTVQEFLNEEEKQEALSTEPGWPGIELRWCIKKGFISLEG